MDILQDPRVVNRSSPCGILVHKPTPDFIWPSVPFSSGLFLSEEPPAFHLEATCTSAPMTLSVLCHRENLTFISPKVKSMAQELSKSYQVGINVAGQFAPSLLLYYLFIYILHGSSLGSTMCLQIVLTNCSGSLVPALQTLFSILYLVSIEP